MRRSLLFLFALTALCQQPSAPPTKPEEPFTLRSATKLVQVNVVAVDKKGRPVDDLKPEDFQISEDGKPQKLAIFGLVRSTALVERPATLPPNIFSNRAAKSGLPASVTVILLDGLNTSWEDQTRVRAQAMRFLSAIRPADRIALYTLGRGLCILHDFTNETSELIAKLSKYRGENDGSLAASAIPAIDNENGASSSPFDRLMLDDPTAPTLREAEFYTTQRVLNTLKTMEAIADHLAGLPGRKSLIWVSGSFPLTMGMEHTSNPGAPPTGPPPERRTFFQELRQATRRLNNAGVAVYPVDARGLMTDSRMSAEHRGLPPVNVTAPITRNLDAMKELASATGGRAFYNRNDIDNAIRTAAEDGLVTYTIGYYPEKEPDDRYHEIKVRVTRPDVSVRHRKGYFAYRSESATEDRRKSELAQAFWSPLDATALAVSARVDHNALTDEFEVTVQLSPEGVSLERKLNRWSGQVDFSFLQKDEEGKSHAGQRDTITLNLTEANYKAMMEGGLLHRKRVRRAARSSILRIVARDASSGLLGSLTVPVKTVQSYTPAKTPER